MNLRAEASRASLDTIKLVSAACLLLAGIVLFYLLESYSTLLGVVSLLAIGAGAAALGLQTAPGRALWQFVADVRVEVRKVVWPTRQETLQTTLVVITMVIILGIILWIFDLLLMAILRFLTGQGG